MNTTTFIFWVIGAVFLLGLIFYVIWLNRASDQNLSLIFRVYASLALAGGLLLLSMFFPLPEFSTDVHVLFVHNENKELAPLLTPLIRTGSAHVQGYRSLEEVWAQWEYKQKKENAKSGAISDGDVDEFYLDLFEKTFWFWLSERYGIHWMVKRYQFYGISGGGGSISSAPNAEKPVCTLRKQDIVKLLSGNSLVLGEGMLGDVKLPAGSEVTVKRDQFRRTIEICNECLQLKIELMLVGGGPLGGATLAKKIIREWTPTSSKCGEKHINVSFHCQYKRWRRWSPSTERQKEWLKEMVSMFRNDFEWPLIRNDLEKGFDTME